jgi:hypothetical protein
MFLHPNAAAGFVGKRWASWPRRGGAGTRIAWQKQVCRTEKVGKRNADTTQRQAGLIICGRRVHGVCVVASVAVAASFKRGFAS